MKKWKPLNIELRSQILVHSLRLEQVSTDILKKIVVGIKENPKTLGNQSSSLSFKTKIDFLYDLDDISKEEYNKYLKFMEIRNQFAHNSECNTFESLIDINDSITNFLLKKYKSIVVEGRSNEENLSACYNKMVNVLIGKLLVLDIEYGIGLKNEVISKINSRIMDDIDEVWECAITNYNEKYSTDLQPTFGLIQEDSTNLDLLFLTFKTCISEKGVQLSTALTEDPDGIKKLFSQRHELIKKEIDS